VTDTDNEKVGKIQQRTRHRDERWGGHNNLVLMREDRGLPEASLDNSSTAELSGFVQPVQHLNGGLPVDTGISNANTVLESRGAILRDILLATVNVRLDHHTSDGAVAGDQLLANRVDDLRLVEVVFERVSVRAINHDARFILRTGLLEGISSSLDVSGVIVRTLRATSEDDMDVLVTGGLDDGSEAIFGNAHEGVRVGGGLHGINGDTDASISPVLETDGERDTRGELAVELGLRGTSTDSTPRDEVSDVLGRDGIKKLGSDGDTKVGKVAQELTSKTEALVDLERPVEVWVVDEPFPPNGCAWFFKVGTHDDEEITPFWYLRFEELRVSDGLLWRMDRAGANDDEDPIIVSGQNSSGVVAGRSDSLLGGGRGDDLVTK